MQRQQSLTVRPTQVGIFALSGGTYPSLGSVQPISDLLLSEASGGEVGEDGFPVHAVNYQDSIRLSQQHPDSCFKHNPDMDNLAARLKHARDLKGWSQPDLAQRSGVKQSFIGALEAENQKSSSWLPELAHALDVSCYWLKTGKGSMRHDAATTSEELIRNSQLDPEISELAQLIKQIPNQERQAMLTMLRARFSLEIKPARKTPTKIDALEGFSDITEKARTKRTKQHK